MLLVSSSILTRTQITRKYKIILAKVPVKHFSSLSSCSTGTLETCAKWHLIGEKVENRTLLDESALASVDSTEFTDSNPLKWVVYERNHQGQCVHASNMRNTNEGLLNVTGVCVKSNLKCNRRISCIGVRSKMYGYGKWTHWRQGRIVTVRP